MSKKQRTEQEFIKETVEGYLENNDWRVQENSNVGFSIGGQILHGSGTLAANYWLNEVYPQEIKEAHASARMHIHDLSMLAPYCAGWSIRQLIAEGLGGIPDKITSAPARHLNTLMQQIVNFLGITQNCWAGAQALSSFDTYIAPFVKLDNMTDKEIRQCMQTFIFGINTPSRWGCVDEATKVLTVNGFKAYNELNEGDMIYTWKDGNLNVMPVKKVVIKKNESGKMHVYSGRNYLQQVTDYHRCLIRKFNSKDTEIKTSKEIFGVKTPYSFPAMFDGSLIEGISLTDDEIRISAMLYTDGSLDYRNGALHHVKLHKSKRRWKDSGIENVLNNIPVKFTITDTKQGSFGSTMRTISFLGESRYYLENLVGQKSKIHPNFFRMNQRQAQLFLKTWALFDGDENKMLLQCDNETIVEQIQHIAVLAGWTSHLVFKKLVSGKKTTYVKIKQIRDVKPSNRYEVDYDGIVWCPNTDDGTAVFMKEGNVFISGNSQAPFSNITLDWVCPADLKNTQAMVGGIEQPFTYGDCQPEIDRVNKIFMEVMVDGDANGRGFQYPIPTYNITKDFDWEHPNCELLFSMTAKYGTPYFANFINSDMKPEDIRSMCCRLSLDKRELRKRGGGLFGSDEFTGSIGVVTINLPQLAYLANKEAVDGNAYDLFHKKLAETMGLAKQSLEIKRHKLNEWFDQGMYPYTKRYLYMKFKNHFNTIGLVGMHEACLNLLGEGITTDKGRTLAEDTLVFMRNLLIKFQEETGNMYNLEATPAESTSYRLALHDKKNYPDIITSGIEEPYYTNSTQLPVGYTENIVEALNIQEPLQTKYTGGTVFHAMLGERITDWKSCRALVKMMCTQYKIPYISISPIYSICAEHGYLDGEQAVCPKCGKATEVYARIVGYYRAIKNWNKGKREEKKFRVSFTTKDLT